MEGVNFEYKEVEYSVDDINNIIFTIVNDIKPRTFDRIPISNRRIDILTGRGGLKLVSDYNKKYPVNDVYGIYMPQHDMTDLPKMFNQNELLSSFTLDVYFTGKHISRYTIKI